MDSSPPAPRIVSTDSDDVSPGPPAPLRREPPRGPDPYTEDRAQARAEARAGSLCAVNQHGCMYFSASEWRFCPMCEWTIGHQQGENAGELAPLGGTVADDAADRGSGDTILISMESLNELLKKPGTRSFLGPVSGYIWEKFSSHTIGDSAVLTRSQLHNLFMIQGSPTSCLTDLLWATLKKQWPSS